MKFLALDLELNQPSNKIIQVGISIADITDEKREYLTRAWYVDPGEPITEFITELTGITDDDVKNKSNTLQEIADDISRLSKENDVFVNPVTWGGGDSIELLETFKNNNVHFPHFGRRWIDVKTWYVYLMLARYKTTSGGLASAMGEFKIPFEGKAHRADVDAYNTLRFFFHLLKRQQGLESLVKIARTV